jgi:subtilase family serine protease
MRSRTIAVGLGLFLVLIAGLAYGLSQSSRSPGRPPAAERLLGRTRASAQVRFALVLKLDQRRVNRAMAELYQPGSPGYHRFIDASAFGRRFGISDARLARLRRTLGHDGLRISSEYPQRTAIDVTAPAGVVDRLFGVRLMNYLTASGRRFHAPLGVPTLPRALRGSVSGVAGLSGRFSPHPDDVPGGALTPTTASVAYDISPLYERGIRGQGERIALISFARFSQSDLDDFARRYNLPSFTPVDIPSPQDGPAQDSSADGVGEADLDAEVVHAIAPQAEILNYSAPIQSADGGDTFGQLVDKIVADGKANIVSDSYGFCELTFPGADIQRDEQAIDSAVLHGISIFKSSGDSGAYQCQRSDPSNTRLSVEWPASSAGVIAVGGTTLSTTSTGAYAGESAWEGTITQSGGGGGVSALVPRPGWQRAPGVINRFSNGRRQLPDVSASANPFYGWAIVRAGSVEPTGGTSAASPFMAGAMALVEQYARQHGINRLGFVAPLLYQVAASPEKLPPFHDVTLGNNRYYPATPGWDFATGLGSPDVYNLAQDVVDYVQAHPSR